MRTFMPASYTNLIYIFSNQYWYNADRIAVWANAIGPLQISHRYYKFNRKITIKILQNNTNYRYNIGINISGCRCLPLFLFRPYGAWCLCLLHFFIRILPRWGFYAFSIGFIYSSVKLRRGAIIIKFCTQFLISSVGAVL